MSKENLIANNDPEVYAENLKYADTLSGVKSKRRLATLKEEQRKKRAEKGGVADEIELGDRDLQTLKQLLNFRRQQPGAPGSPGGLSRGGKVHGKTHGNYVSLDEEVGAKSTASMRKLKRGKSKREVGLLQSLNPADTELPKALTVAIHSTVVDNVGEEVDTKEAGVAEKAQKKMKEVLPCRALLDLGVCFWLKSQCKPVYSKHGNMW